MADTDAAYAEQEQLFDDRIDTEPRIDNVEVARVLGRSVRLLGSERRLFVAKLVLALMALLPALYMVWLPKIVVDQVLLQRPFDQSAVPYPPHVAPFVDMLQGLGPMEIMAAVTGFLVVLLCVVGRGGTWVGFAQGEDSATQSENQINAGGSQAAGLVGVADTLVQTRLSQRLTNRLRSRLFRRMAGLPMTTLDDHRIGDAVYRVMYDAPMLPGMCYRVTIEPLFRFLNAVIALYLMHYSYGEVAPILVWCAAAMLPIGLLITIPFAGLARTVQQRSRAAGAATTNAIEETLGNIDAVQSLGGVNRDQERIEGQSRESFRRFRHIRLVSIVIEFTTLFALVGFGFWASLFVTDQIIDGVMTPGDYSVLFGLGITLSSSAMAIGRFWIDLQANAAAVRRVLFFIDLPSERRGTGRSIEPPTSVRLEGVDFTYPGGVAALEGIDLTFARGELIALVGPTGAGKTSLAYLVPGFIRPTAGRVLFDGVDIAQCDVAAVREQVSYVFQEHLLLSESIRDNLLLVNPAASDEDISRSLEAAGAMEFVRELPEGLDTVLGRSGDTLSVGQKQRLSIARGLVRETPIVILDEPTAALDPATEHALVTALQASRKDRLVIIIAHRLSTIRQADRIVFIEEGRVTDIGSHDELMADPGSRYRRFVELQQGM